MAQPIHIITIPFASGRRDFRASTGPERILQVGFIRQLEAAQQTIALVQILDLPSDFDTDIEATFELHRRLSIAVDGAVQLRHFPLVLSGNCFATVGAVSGQPKEELGVVWFDAHGDFSTPDTTTTGFLDGMGLACLTGRGFHALAASVPGFQAFNAVRVLHVGGRDIPEREAVQMRQSGMHVVPAQTLNSSNPNALAEGITALNAVGVRRVHVHFDLDALDPDEAPANSHNVAGGLSVADTAKMLVQVRNTWPISSVTFSSYDPSYDPEGRTARAVATLARALIA